MLTPEIYPILQQCPAKNPDVLQLYSFPTPNGVKISIMLEEIGLPYEAHLVHIGKDETWTDEYLSLNPNGKIPAILDPNGYDGKPFVLFESGAILLYLAEKTGKLLPTDPAKRMECIQWVFYQMAGLGPILGQVGFFYKYAGKAIEDKRPLERYATETTRVLGVLNDHLADKKWMMGNDDTDYSIADIVYIGWISNITAGYDAAELLYYDRFTHLQRWLADCLARPAVKKGLTIPEVV